MTKLFSKPFKITCSPKKDHDYGINNAGIEYPCKKESQLEFAIHLNIPKSDPRHPENPIKENRQEGVYSSHMFAVPKSYDVPKDHGGIHVINLDTRFHRHRLASGADKPKCYLYGGGGEKTDILGEKQWKWLENELLKKTSEIKMISSSIQVLAPFNFGRDLHTFCAYDKDSKDKFMDAMIEVGEKRNLQLIKQRRNENIWSREMWADVPWARLRLLQLAQRSINSGRAKVVVFSSGDIHMGEINAKLMPLTEYGGKEQILYEVAASGIGTGRRKDLLNDNRVKVRTCDNKGDGQFVYECKFPFKWKGTVYRDCVPPHEESKQPAWCIHNRSTAAWGFCIPKRRN